MAFNRTTNFGLEVDEGLARACMRVLRRLGQIDHTTLPLLRYRPKELRVTNMLRLGAAQLLFLSTPAHAAVAETVNAVKLLKGSSLRGLINGVLRNFQRSAEVILLRIDRVPSIRLGVAERADVIVDFWSHHVAAV